MSLTKVTNPNTLLAERPGTALPENCTKESEPAAGRLRFHFRASNHRTIESSRDKLARRLRRWADGVWDLFRHTLRMQKLIGAAAAMRSILDRT